MQKKKKMKKKFQVKQVMLESVRHYSCHVWIRMSDTIFGLGYVSYFRIRGRLDPLTHKYDPVSTPRWPQHFILTI
ncbi:hypothetical protein HanIR_Chr15g0735701 [Helianthus annuus]|nr:hypothetical protein HanIR_Chr15g0735701 [Helianthus annuus]